MAEVLKISAKTVQREWNKAKAWLYYELSKNLWVIRSFKCIHRRAKSRCARRRCQSCVDNVRRVRNLLVELS